MEEGVTEDRPPPSVQREVTDRDPDEPFVETAAEQASRLLRVTEILARLLDAADSTIARYQALESKLNARIAELAGMEEAVELAMSQRAEAERKLRAVVQAAIDAGWDLPPVPR